MSRYTRGKLLHMIELLQRAAEMLPEVVREQEPSVIVDYLGDCQNGAIALGSTIEKDYGLGTDTVAQLEGFCESIYRISERFSDLVERDQAIRNAQEQVKLVGEIFEKECPSKLEVVFFPYKASMWDSLESIWIAAESDPNCDAYVVPIPYFEKNPDRTNKLMHYEGELFPDNVPIISYEDYILDERKPDIAYIHNPYDGDNLVTAVAEEYFSYNLKKYVGCLVYVPYYVTSGSMADARGLCSAYLHVDYIVLQASKFLKFFDEVIPREKFLVFGSPKFDRVIRMCENPPEPPEDWKSKMDGKKVYFYNTSINGMLAQTENYLKKMWYVFEQFEGREDACILWRPHPLLASTFDSMRPAYRAEYDRLMDYFMEHDLGILDQTADITSTIAQCDGLIGDGISSVLTLFGMAGKPIFALDDGIHRLPGPEDWRGEIVYDLFPGSAEWVVNKRDRLFHSEGNGHYRYVCNLNEYNGGWYYCRAYEIDGSVYVCPRNSQNVVVVHGGAVEKRVMLERHMEKGGSFADALVSGKYLFLIPIRYPYVVRYDTQSGEILYLDHAQELYCRMVRDVRRWGGRLIWQGYLVLTSPADDTVLFVRTDTMEVQVCQIGLENYHGSIAVIADKNWLWLLPAEGDKVVRWDPETGKKRVYEGFPEGFFCIDLQQNYHHDNKPFSGGIRDGNRMIFSPELGNMFLELDIRSGEFKEWEVPFSCPKDSGGGYHPNWTTARFVDVWWRGSDRICTIFHGATNRLYEVNLRDQSYHEIPMEFDMDELREQEPGFANLSEWSRYRCNENSFNSLKDFLDGNITGSPYDRKEALRCYGEIAANPDGTCGEKLHQYICEKVQEGT